MEAMPLPAEKPSERLLDRMISITRGLFPAVSDLARELRYRCFDQPLFEKARKQIYAEAESHLDYLAANPDAAGPPPESTRADRMSTTARRASCPAGLQPRHPPLQQLMLEVIISRYYGVRTLTDFRTLSHGWALLRVGPIRRERQARPCLRHPC